MVALAAERSERCRARTLGGRNEEDYLDWNVHRDRWICNGRDDGTGTADATNTATTADAGHSSDERGELGRKSDGYWLLEDCAAGRAVEHSRRAARFRCDRADRREILTHRRNIYTGRCDRFVSRADAGTADGDAVSGNGLDLSLDRQPFRAHSARGQEARPDGHDREIAGHGIGDTGGEHGQLDDGAARRIGKDHRRHMHGRPVAHDVERQLDRGAKPRLRSGCRLERQASASEVV